MSDATVAGRAGRESVRINGREYLPSPDEYSMFLIDYLRERLDLTGTKRGCDIGVCGSCTVVVDGRARRSCRVTVEAVLGSDVLTIEGLESPGGALHPIQQAFVEAGAVQCGFCTPGMIMSACALLGKVKRPTRDEIRRALAGNLCRCTGYQQIVDAIGHAASDLYPDAPAVSEPIA